MILDLFRLDGKVAIVTAAGRGHRRGIARPSPSRRRRRHRRPQRGATRRGGRGVASVGRGRSSWPATWHPRAGWPSWSSGGGRARSARHGRQQRRWHHAPAFLDTRAGVRRRAALERHHRVQPHPARRAPYAERGAVASSTSRRPPALSYRGFAAYGTAKAALIKLTGTWPRTWRPHPGQRHLAGSIATSALDIVLQCRSSRPMIAPPRSAASARRRTSPPPRSTSPPRPVELCHRPGHPRRRRHPWVEPRDGHARPLIGRVGRPAPTTASLPAERGPVSRRRGSRRCRRRRGRAQRAADGAGHAGPPPIRYTYSPVPSGSMQSGLDPGVHGCPGKSAPAGCSSTTSSSWRSRKPTSS